LRWGQRVLYGLLVAGAISLAFWPRRRSPLRLAAYTGALLVGFEAVLTHWSWLYLPWFFPFVAFALLATRTGASMPVLVEPRREQVRLMRENWTPVQLPVHGARARGPDLPRLLEGSLTLVLRTSKVVRHGIFQVYSPKIGKGWSRIAKWRL